MKRKKTGLKKKIDLEAIARKLEAESEKPKIKKLPEKKAAAKETVKEIKKSDSIADSDWKATALIPEFSSFVDDSDEPVRFVPRRRLAEEAFEDSSPLAARSANELDLKGAYEPGRPTGKCEGASYMDSNKYDAEVSEQTRVMEKARDLEVHEMTSTERLLQSQVTNPEMGLKTEAQDYSIKKKKSNI